MPSGGSRAGAGRPPDPESLRQASAVEANHFNGEWIELPAAGRRGRAPAWPLPTSTNAAERKLWNRLWKSPQAIMWDQLGQEMQVALYVRRAIEAEERGASSSLTTVVLRLADNLGISVLGMRQLRWKVVDRAAAPKDSAPARKQTAKTSSKQRLTVVKGDG